MKPFSQDTQKALAVAAGFACCLLGLWHLFMSFRHSAESSLPILLKGYAVLLGLLASLAVLAIARKAPRLLCRQECTYAAAVLYLGGLIALQCGLADVSDLLLGTGYIFMLLGLLWLLSLTCLTATKLTSRNRILALSGGFALRSVLVSAASLLLPIPLGGWIFSVFIGGLGALTCLLLARFARPSLSALATQESPAELERLHPSSFLPFSNKLFFMIVFLTCVCSFGCSSQQLTDYFAGNSLFTNVLSVALLGALLVRQKGAPSVDQLFYLACITVIIGFEVGSVWTAAPPLVNQAGVSTLVAGADLANLFIYVLLFQLAARNPYMAIPLISFALAAFNLGLIVDSSLWALSSILPGYSVAVIFSTAFIVYTMLYTRSYSFEGAIQQVAALENQQSPYPLEDRLLYIERTHQLTARERDIFRLMARGRNSPFIQKELVVSQNTVKTHTRNIYNKLGVHSHQELIDMVERLEIPDSDE